MHTKVFHIPHGRINELNRTSPPRVFVGKNINCSLKVLLVLLILPSVKISSCDHCRLIFVLVLTGTFDAGNHWRCVQLTSCEVFRQCPNLPSAATRQKADHKATMRWSQPRKSWADQS